MRARWLLPVLLLVGAGADVGVHHARAVSTLKRLAAGTTEGIVKEDLVLDVNGTQVPARIYRADGAPANQPGLVVCHGVHRLGIEEPRLMRFAHALAGSGLTVLTPRIDALTDYHIDPSSVPTISVAASTLAKRTGHQRAGVMGFSFAGGLSLIAASQPETSRAIGMVVAVGAHDDLARVVRFFARGESSPPHGAPVPLHPHEYGPLVFAYGSPDRFFAAEDIPIARDAIRARLWEQPDEAKAKAKGFSPAGAQRWQELLEGNRAAIAPLLEKLANENEAPLLAASPHLKLGGVHVPVFLLHGAGDSVIPPTETEWLASEVPPEQLRESLVSPVIQHVELHGEPTWREQYAVVHFLAAVVGALDDL